MHTDILYATDGELEHTVHVLVCGFSTSSYSVILYPGDGATVPVDGEEIMGEGQRVGGDDGPVCFGF
jgi:hypothetical protein